MFCVNHDVAAVLLKLLHFIGEASKGGEDLAAKMPPEAANADRPEKSVKPARLAVGNQIRTLIDVIAINYRLVGDTIVSLREEFCGARCKNGSHHVGNIRRNDDAFALSSSHIISECIQLGRDLR